MMDMALLRTTPTAPSVTMATVLPVLLKLDLKRSAQLAKPSTLQLTQLVVNAKLAPQTAKHVPMTVPTQRPFVLMLSAMTNLQRTQLLVHVMLVPKTVILVPMTPLLGSLKSCALPMVVQRDTATPKLMNVQLAQPTVRPAPVPLLLTLMTPCSAILALIPTPPTKMYVELAPATASSAPTTKVPWIAANVLPNTPLTAKRLVSNALQTATSAVLDLLSSALNVPLVTPSALMELLALTAPLLLSKAVPHVPELMPHLEKPTAPPVQVVTCWKMENNTNHAKMSAHWLAELENPLMPLPNAVLVQLDSQLP